MREEEEGKKPTCPNVLFFFCVLLSLSLSSKKGRKGRAKIFNNNFSYNDHDDNRTGNNNKYSDESSSDDCNHEDVIRITIKREL